MNRARKDPNLKVPFESVEQLRKINEKLIDIGFDNIKVFSIFVPTCGDNYQIPLPSVNS